MELQTGISFVYWEVLFGNANEFVVCLCPSPCHCSLWMIGLKRILVRVEVEIRGMTFHALGLEYSCSCWCFFAFVVRFWSALLYC